MPFSIDFLDDGRVLEWEATADGAVATERKDYTPRFYVAARSSDADIDLTALRLFYERHPNVVATEITTRRPGFRRDDEKALAVDVDHIARVTPLARQARQLTEYPVGDLACFNVDFSREFRYCLETGVDPTPTSELSTLQLAVPLTETTGDAYEELSVADETVKGPPGDILTAVQDAIDEHDPDVLVCSTSDIVPTLYEMASTAGVDEFTLSRWPDVDYQQLASRSTYASYGQVGHSPARYNVPGRAIVDESNTFFYGETNLDGILDLVSRSKKPLQETAWASIGNVLTAIQICEAHDRDVLVPWNSWRHERYKSMGTLHDADRGGFIFAPEVGLHDDVHELDFSSLYPNIICTQNVAALKRAREQDLAVHPGQDIEYVIVDDEKSSRDRVALAHEEIETYDASYYETQLVRAVESVLSPLGIDRTDIRKKLSPEKETVLSSFGAVNDTS
jgi:DNA polymerase I